MLLFESVTVLCELRFFLRFSPNGGSRCSEPFRPYGYADTRSVRDQVRTIRPQWGWCISPLRLLDFPRGELTLQELSDGCTAHSRLLLEVLLYVHRNRRLIRDGSPGCPPRFSHSSLALTLGCERPVQFPWEQQLGYPV